MNKQNVSIPTLTIATDGEQKTSVQPVDPEWQHRLIILIPTDSDCTALTRRIWRLANETSSDVQLLGLGKDTAQELSLRRDLATMSALIQDAKVLVKTRVEIGTNWLDAVKRNYQEGDMIVCIAEQSIGIRRRPLSQILESNFKVPIYILSNSGPTQSQPNMLTQIIAWSGFVGIIAGFFLLQMKIVQMPDDWFQTLLSVLLLIPEFGLILLWNSLF